MKFSSTLGGSYRMFAENLNLITKSNVNTTSFMGGKFFLPTTSFNTAGKTVYFSQLLDIWDGFTDYDGSSGFTRAFSNTDTISYNSSNSSILSSYRGFNSFKLRDSTYGTFAINGDNGNVQGGARLSAYFLSYLDYTYDPQMQLRGFRPTATITSQSFDSLVIPNQTAWLDYSPSFPSSLVAMSLMVTPTPVPSSTGNAVKLTWQTALEKNADYFGVERADGNSDFAPIGIVNSYANSGYTRDYEFIDASDFNSNELYYRLKQTLLSGKFDYSNTVKVNIVNPKGSFIYLDRNADAFVAKTNGGNVRIMILDLNGRVHYNNNTNLTYQKIDASQLSSGMYIGTITDANGNTSSFKIVK